MQNQQKQEPRFVVEIEPLRSNKEYQKRRFLSYAGKSAQGKKEVT